MEIKVWIVDKRWSFKLKFLKIKILPENAFEIFTPNEAILICLLMDDLSSFSLIKLT